MSGSAFAAMLACALSCRKAQQRFRERQRARLAESEERLRHLSGALAQLQARVSACCPSTLPSSHAMLSEMCSTVGWCDRWAPLRDGRSHHCSVTARMSMCRGSLANDLVQASPSDGTSKYSELRRVSRNMCPDRIPHAKTVVRMVAQVEQEHLTSRNILLEKLRAVRETEAAETQAQTSGDLGAQQASDASTGTEVCSGVSTVTRRMQRTAQATRSLCCARHAALTHVLARA